MAGLQQKDARAFQGLLSMIALGYFVDSIKSPSWDDRDWLSMDRLVQAIDHSGATGIFFDLNNMLEQTSAVGQVLGPSVGLPSNLIKSFVDPEAQTSDQLKAVRRLLPFNQLFWWVDLVDKIERTAIEATE